jgi:chromosomal replication initiator protein
VLDEDPGQRIVYLSCESFVNHFVEAVEKGAVHGFRHRYRHADMLLIDDVQFLARGDHTRDEFFHTFNSLYQEQKQIVLTADCSPTDIPHLEERMISRFKWGLVARVDSPCLETRLAILQKKLRQRGLDVPRDAVLNIASTVRSNSRELEGALNRIQSLAQLESRPIDLALTQKALNQDAAPEFRSVRVPDIMGLLTSRYGIKLSDLTGRKRSRSIVLPRQVGMYLARRFTQHSLAEIGGFFGGRDHSTVLHANRLVDGKRNADQEFRARLDEMEDALRRAP